MWLPCSLSLPSGSSAALATDSEQPEVLQILSPAPKAVIQGGLLHLAGFGGPAFEQTLNVNIYDENSQRVGGGPVTIQADAGEAGTFAIDLPYSVAQSQAGYVEVYMDSPRDGGSTHVSTVDVTLGP